jgi:hypothetical protein
MCLGYLGGISWFALIKWSLWMDFQVSEGASLLSKTLVFLWTHNGEGVNPSFVTTLVPLVVIPVVSVWFRDPIESERSSITDY